MTVTVPALEAAAREAAAQVFVADVRSPQLSPADEIHLAGALRLRPGERVLVADGAGRWQICEIAPGEAADVTRDRPSGRRPRDRRRPEIRLLPLAGTTVVEEMPPAAPVSVAFALPKGDRAEWAVQKLTEVGVDRIIPLVTDRSVVRPTGTAGAERVERFRRVAREAAMQCRRVFLPLVEEIVTLDDLLSASGEAVPGDRASALARPALASPAGRAPTLEHRFLVVGPEGGFSERELGLGLPQVRLGPHVLRAETAAIVAGSVLVGLRTLIVAPVGDDGG